MLVLMLLCCSAGSVLCYSSYMRLLCLHVTHWPVVAATLHVRVLLLHSMACTCMHT